ncbi:AAA family ATPase [Vibrio nigripulchritudo]|nr:ATP-binding protein [Vibrio nigripulchritudo]BDU37931.1 hypothetical protein TUMSATVNIG2_24000 [Vibrio nigripulchritudo]BDU43653.1 hypothetical protein TUMSATVNIG3_24510 [Vibrio nigripulchritudo]
MLIELFVENFRSIRERQQFSLIKSTNDDLRDNFFTPESQKNTPLLRSAAVYGANAAGKSNFILGLGTMKRIVLSSAKDSQRGERLPVKPFLLSEGTSNAPTEFEVLFISQGVKYQYGFSVTKDRIVDEWLFAYPKGRPQRWFIRAFDNDTGEYAWDFSSLFQGKKQVWKDATKSNSLFLSTAVMLNSEQLLPIFDWFKDTLKVAGIGGWGPVFTAELCEEQETKLEVLKFLKSADLDITDISLEQKKIDESFFSSDMPKEVKDMLLADLEEREFVDIKTIHKGHEGQSVLFDLEDESDGTRKLFSFAGPWLDSLKNGRVLFIDELHDSLHPTMVKFLINLFNNKKTNPNNAQLVFTTHETSVLDQNVFRRDQIWFCEKQSGESSLFPLTDFSPRKGAENLEKAYLSGRYGALPLVSNLELLGDTDGER